MRDVMREIDQDSDGRISLMEWLLFEFNKTVGTNPALPNPALTLPVFSFFNLFFFFVLVLVEI